MELACRLCSPARDSWHRAGARACGVEVGGEREGWGGQAEEGLTVPLPLPGGSPGKTDVGSGSTAWVKLGLGQELRSRAAGV